MVIWDLDSCPSCLGLTRLTNLGKDHLAISARCIFPDSIIPFVDIFLLYIPCG